MPNNDNISIGGVRFNKQDVQKSETIKQDGKVMNSVFLRDGTKVVYPNQAGNNESMVVMSDKTKKERSGVGIDMSSGNVTINYGQPGVMGLGDKEVKTGEVDINFYRMNGAEITGTEKHDDYTLSGCQNTNVDVSQKDGSRDIVFVKDDNNKYLETISGKKVKQEYQHSKEGKVFVSGNNQVSQNKEDSTFLKKDGKVGFLESRYNEHKGKGTIKE